MKHTMEVTVHLRGAQIRAEAGCGYVSLFVGDDEVVTFFAKRDYTERLAEAINSAADAPAIHPATLVYARAE